MTADDYNAFCASLPAVQHVVQWGGADVWKVDIKVFAVGWFDDQAARITFKASDLSYEVLSQQPGLRPAPYFASRGMKWIQDYGEPGLTDDELKDYLRESHRLASFGLTKKRRRELGLAE